MKTSHSQPSGTPNGKTMPLSKGPNAAPNYSSKPTKLPKSRKI